MLNESSTNISLVPCSENKFPQCIAALYIWRTVPVLLFITGSLGNFLCILVLCRRHIRNYSVAVYLLFLAMSDLTFLWSSVLRNTLYRGYQVDIKVLSVVHCRLNDWATMTSGAFSSFIVALLTIERTVLTRCSRNNQHKMTANRVRVTLIIVLLVISLANSHLIYGYNSITYVSETVGQNNDTVRVESTKCVFINNDYRHFYTTEWAYIILLFYNVIPVAIIATGNIIIAMTIWKQKVKVKPASETSVSSQQNLRSNTATRTLFILSAFYILTVTPYCVFVIIQNRIIRSLNEYQLAMLELANALVFMLGYCNFSLNFFMYSTGASLFRKEWKGLVNNVKSKLGNFCDCTNRHR